MKIIDLVENTMGDAGCPVEHGLSLYIETEKHKLLMDAGASGLFLANAEKKGVDLSSVDIMVLSHGHYDHGGGIPDFALVNNTASIYMQKSALDDCYSLIGGEHYIGLPDKVRELKNIIMLNGDHTIDKDIELFASIPFERPAPSTNRDLMMKVDGKLKRDEFSHEQCLVVREQGMSVLFSGCAHHGILNILSAYRKQYGHDPDYVVSGFHLMRNEGYSRENISEIEETARELMRLHTVFYTGHCTGVEPYRIMKDIMGERLIYLHCGDEVILPNKSA